MPLLYDYTVRQMAEIILAGIVTGASRKAGEIMYDLSISRKDTCTQFIPIARYNGEPGLAELQDLPDQSSTN